MAPPSSAPRGTLAGSAGIHSATRTKEGAADLKLTTGTYQYASTVGGASYRGTLDITHATGDSIAAVWHLSGLQDRADLRFRNGDAYVLNAHMDGNARIFAHRIRPDLSANEVLGDIGTCTLTKQK